ncbi:MAG: 2Fe-2S iron-sulfur cluster-binding protein [Candidatus Methanomethylicia archaeon]|jgi:succinate dehydrogenase/fumarate reductase iron-sulfur protein|nr:2Fe-2S iron-sulfur cluster-binding protein [Candidatus Methanomethylicia archaeon]
MAIKTIKVKVFRFNPRRDSSPHYDVFEVPYTEGMSVLNALVYIYENIDPSLAIPYSCRIGRCGWCTLLVNGKATQTCTTLLKGDVTVEPLPLFEVIKDLIYDVDHPKRLNHSIAKAPPPQ